MLLAIDVGNTNTVFAVFEGSRLHGQWRMSTHSQRTADEYGIWLRQILHASTMALTDVKAVIIASVVPATLFALRDLAARYFHCHAIVVGERGINHFIRNETDRPSEVGADRLVNAFAAHRRYPGDLIVVDFGTATTFDVVTATGGYAGGVIAPGIDLSLEALHRAAAKLPTVDITMPAKVIGTNTVSAIQSGIFYGYLGMIEGIVGRIRNERQNPDMVTIATGGLAPLFARATSCIEHLDSDLTIEGLRLVYDSQCQSNKENIRHAALPKAVMA